jgi:hypothetical protein
MIVGAGEGRKMWLGVMERERRISGMALSISRGSLYGRLSQQFLGGEWPNGQMDG